MAAEISSYYESLETLLRSHFGGRVVTIGDYNDFDGGKIKSPALLIDIESMPIGSDDGDEKLPINLHVVIHCVLGIKTPNVQRKVRDMAAEVMATLRYKKIDSIGLVTAFPKIDEAAPGSFRAGEHGYESQQVRFTHEIKIGASVWDSDLTVPTEVLLSMSPDIGIPHEPDYKPAGGAL